MNELIEWSEGNPGALTFLAEVFLNPNSDFRRAAIISHKINACPTLRGTNLYVLYSDLCDRDLTKVTFLCENCPNDILEDACSRQDYSGRELIKDYVAW